MWWFTTRKSGVSAVNLQELLDFGSYRTAWTWLQKLRRCTIRQDREKLSGRVEVDEFFIGGQRSGKRGRGAEGKAIVFIAVERSATEKRMGRIRLHVALDCSGYSLETFILENIAPGSMIATDDRRSYHVIDKERYHRQTTNQSKRKNYDKLYGAHLVTTLVKRLIRGTFQGQFKTQIPSEPLGRACLSIQPPQIVKHRQKIHAHCPAGGKIGPDYLEPNTMDCGSHI